MKILRQKPLFLVSLQDNLDRDIIQPKVPQTLLVQQKHADYKTKRICFYPSIDSALTAFSTTLKGVTLFVYQPVGLHTDSLVKPNIMSVPTAPITGEYWYLAPIQLKKVATVKVLKASKPLEYTYGPRSTKDYLYKWSWEEVLKPWEKKKKEKEKEFSKKPYTKTATSFEKWLKKRKISGVKSTKAVGWNKPSEPTKHFADQKFIKDLKKTTNSAKDTKEKLSALTDLIGDPTITDNPQNLAYAIREQNAIKKANQNNITKY